MEGFYFRHAHHVVYWRHLSNGDIGIVTILHERMHQIDRFKDGYAPVTLTPEVGQPVRGVKKNEDAFSVQIMDSGEWRAPHFHQRGAVT